MQNHNDIIGILKNHETATPPDDIVLKVMEGAKKAEKSFPYKFFRLFFRHRRLSPDLAGVLSGKIVSPAQCAFLLSAAGLFYLLMGLFVLAGMRGVLSGEDINFWLRLQPYLAIISGCFIIGMALIVRSKPQAVVSARYGIIAHTAFVFVNALIVQFALVFPAALVFFSALSALAISLGILLISRLDNFIKAEPFDARTRFAQNI